MMIGAFIVVTAQSFKNRIVAGVRRLKQPRYAVGALLAAVYFGSLFFRNRGGGKFLAQAGALDLRADVVSVVVLFLMLFAWALPADSGGLEFSEAEIALLFPAPLRRRDLLLYKIVRAQPQTILGALAFTILGATRGRFIGIWIAFSVLSIYFMLVALGRARLKIARVGFLARLVAVSAIATVLVNVAIKLNRVPFEIRKGSRGDLIAVCRAFFAQSFIRQILFVPRAFALAVFPPSTTALGLALTGCILLGVVFFAIAAMLNVSFEEASIARSQRVNAMRERMRDRRAGRHVIFRRAGSPFRLSESGPPEIAIVWKNVIATMRMSLGTIIAMAALFAAVFSLRIFFPHGAAVTMPIFFIMTAVALPFIGPAIFANDLRLDLSRFEMLKSYPLAGERIVAAEMAAPLAMISLFEIAALICFLLTSAKTFQGPLELVNSTQAAICALIATVPLCALQLLIRNAAPVLFPAWSTRPKEDVRGFAVGGQRLLLLIANAFVLFVALVPAAIVFVPSIIAAQHFFAGSPISYALMTIPAVAVIAVEVWLGIRFLGGRFDELDVSVEMDAVSAI